MRTLTSMKSTHTFSYIKTVTGRISVTVSDEEDAVAEATEQLEKLNRELGEQSSEVGLLDLKEVEPYQASDTNDDE